MTERQIIKIAVTPEAKQTIEEMCARYGMSQIELASRLYQWAAEQDEVVQAAVLGILPEDVAPDVAKLVLERLAAGKGPSPRLTKAAKKAKGSKHVTRRPPRDKPGR